MSKRKSRWKEFPWRVTVKCARESCPKTFTRSRHHHKFCSDNCRTVDWNTKHPRLYVKVLLDPTTGKRTATLVLD